MHHCQQKNPVGDRIRAVVPRSIRKASVLHVMKERKTTAASRADSVGLAWCWNRYWLPPGSALAAAILASRANNGLLPVSGPYFAATLPYIRAIRSGRALMWYDRCYHIVLSCQSLLQISPSRTAFQPQLSYLSLGTENNLVFVEGLILQIVSSILIRQYFSQAVSARIPLRAFVCIHRCQGCSEKQFSVCRILGF